MPMYTPPPPPIDNDDGISNDGELSIIYEQLLYCLSMIILYGLSVYFTSSYYCGWATYLLDVWWSN